MNLLGLFFVVIASFSTSQSVNAAARRETHSNTTSLSAKECEAQREAYLAAHPEISTRLKERLRECLMGWSTENFKEIEHHPELMSTVRKIRIWGGDVSNRTLDFLSAHFSNLKSLYLIDCDLRRQYFATLHSLKISALRLHGSSKIAQDTILPPTLKKLSLELLYHTELPRCVYAILTQLQALDVTLSHITCLQYPSGTPFATKEPGTDATVLSYRGGEHLTVYWGKF